MPKEPEEKRAISFIDRQNLFRHAMNVFGHHHPNYDPKKLRAAVCAAKGWKVAEVRLYHSVSYDCGPESNSIFDRSESSVCSSLVRYSTLSVLCLPTEKSH